MYTPEGKCLAGKLTYDSTSSVLTFTNSTCILRYFADAEGKLSIYLSRLTGHTTSCGCFAGQFFSVLWPLNRISGQMGARPVAKGDASCTTYIVLCLYSLVPRRSEGWV